MTKDKTKERILNFIQKGWTTEKLMDKFPGLKRQQIAAYRAHLTMGHYDK